MEDESDDGCSRGWFPAEEPNLFLVEKVENKWILAIHTIQAIHVDSIPG